jgi:hypothetical protein
VVSRHGTSMAWAAGGAGAATTALGMNGALSLSSRL